MRRDDDKSAEINVKHDVAPPHSAEVERALLGTMLLDGKVAAQLIPEVSPDDFYIPKHRLIYEGLKRLLQQGQPSDLLLLIHDLKVRQLLDEAGGEAYIRLLEQSVASSLHAKTHLAILKELAMRRHLIATSGQIARLAYDEKADINKMIERSQSAIINVRTMRRRREAVTPIATAVSAFFSKLQNMHAHGGEAGIVRTGIMELDRLITGLARGDLVVVAGRPGMGKTSLMLNMAHYIAHTHHWRVAFFSLEMNSAQLLQRLISAETGIEGRQLRRGDLDEAAWDKVTQCLGKIADMPILLNDKHGMKVGEIQTSLQQMYYRHGIDAVFIDYLQLIDGGDQTRGENRTQEIRAICQALKSTARDLNIVCVVASQLSRSVERRENKRPMLSDLMDSGAIEQDADMVLFIHREDAYRPATEMTNIAEIIVGKNRNGPTGIVQTYFDNRVTLFRNLISEAGD